MKSLRDYDLRWKTTMKIRTIKMRYRNILERFWVNPQTAQIYKTHP